MINPRPFRAFRCLSFLAGVLVAALVLLTVPAGAAGNAGGVGQRGQRAAQGTAPSGPVDYFELTGVIDQASARSLIQQVRTAETNGSGVLVIRLDTPGGLRVAVTSIVDRLLAAKVPVAVWIGPSGAQARGAGALIAYAAHILAMAPGTSLGPLLPVNLDAAPGSDPAPALEELRSVATGAGRSAEPLGNGSTTLADAPAAQQGIATFQAGDLSTVLRNLDGRSVFMGDRRSKAEANPLAVKLSVAGAGLRFHKMGVLARFQHTAARPAVAYMFLLLGFFGLVFELYFPGIGAAGLMGGVSLALGIYGLTILPTSWLAVAILVVGILAFIPDMHNGGLGLPTYVGAALVLVGSLRLFPHVPGPLQLPWWATASGEVGCLLFFISIMTAALRARVARPPAGAQSLLGGLGLARTDIAPDGQVSADGSLWRARTVGAAIAEGSTVRVRSVSGLVLMVELAEEAPPAGLVGQPADPTDLPDSPGAPPP